MLGWRLGWPERRQGLEGFTACSSLIWRQDRGGLYFSIPSGVLLPCHSHLGVVRSWAELPVHPSPTHCPPQPRLSCFPGLWGHLQDWKIPAGLRRGFQNSGGEHGQAFILAAFPKRRNLGKWTGSQLVDPAKAEQSGRRGQEGKHCSAAPGVFSAREQIRLRISGIFLICKPALHSQGDLGREQAGYVVVKDRH